MATFYDSTGRLPSLERRLEWPVFFIICVQHRANISRCLSCFGRLRFIYGDYTYKRTCTHTHGYPSAQTRKRLKRRLSFGWEHGRFDYRHRMLTGRWKGAKSLNCVVTLGRGMKYWPPHSFIWMVHSLRDAFNVARLLKSELSATSLREHNWQVLITHYSGRTRHSPRYIIQSNKV